MKKPVRFTDRDREHLLVTIETSLNITKRSQFYLWAQGALQGFIAHDLLLAAYGDISRMSFSHETFSRTPLSPQVEKDLGDSVHGLLPRMVDDWLQSASVPRLHCPDEGGQVGRRQLLADMKRSALGNAIAHGAPEIRGEYGSFFVFAGLKEEPGPRDIYVLELLMPYLHMALYRMLSHEKQDAPAVIEPTALFSKREIQVLYWVKNGKTNQEIAQILHISVPTAKNHVQNIMRKLNVTNRAQAVGKSASLRLIAPGDQA